MDGSKKGSTGNLTCDVCKIDFKANADYALHEFSKKHCDNLIRLTKQKPVVVSKQKTKNEILQIEKEEPKANSVMPVGSFLKFGYFIPGEIHANTETSKEFNVCYDPYLQKLSENPFNEKPSIPPTNETSTFNSVTSFSKKKKKKIKTCQVCSVTLTTVPEYEAHMKSPQHIWKLKVTGMGVSAHFVKASSDLHTTDTSEESKPSYQMEKHIPDGTTKSSEFLASGPFPLLQCNDCELLLNSPQQYNAHIKGKSHIECAQRKAELRAKKEKLETPSPNQLYCYTCKISLNNLFQYNEHKNGKKHKTKCRNLIRNGITVPPEERVPGIPFLNPKKPIIYPELYEKVVLKNQEEKKSEMELVSEALVCENIEKDDSRKIEQSCSVVNLQADNNANVQEVKLHPGFSQKSISVGNVNLNNCITPVAENQNLDPVKTPDIIFNKNCSQICTTGQISGYPVLKTGNSQMEIPDHQKDVDGNKTVEAKTFEEKITATVLKCSICEEIFEWQHQLDGHLVTEDHLKKILEYKLNGRSETDLLNALFLDRSVVKPNNTGKLTCSICNVTADNSIEFDQHLNSIVHKYTQKDYRMKRTIEVKHITESNKDGLYHCKSCKEGWPSLLEYTQHLHFVKHKSILRAQRAKAMLAKRRASHLQKARLLQSLKKINLALRRVKAEKNPGVRTKICGVAVDVNSGIQARIPNLESLEPKIDVTKNVSIGASEKRQNADQKDGPVNKNDTIKMSNVTKRSNAVRSCQKLGVNQKRNGPYNENMAQYIPPLITGPPFRPQFPRPSFSTPNRNWLPFCTPNRTMFGQFYGRPSIGNHHVRPPWFPRSPWPRHR